MLQCAALARHQQDAAGFPVQPVHQFKKACLGSGLSQLLDDPEAHTRAPVDRHAGRLVDREQGFIFHQQRKLAARRRHLHLLSRLLRRPHRRHAHHIARHHTGVRARPPLVHAHFTAADDPVNVGFGHPLQVPDQKIVQPLSRGLLIDHDAANLGLTLSACGGEVAPYNLVH